MTRTFICLPLMATWLAAAPVLSLGTGSFRVKEGENFTVPVLISNITDLYTAQFSLGFDPSFLHFVTQDEGDFLQAGGPTFFVPGTLTAGAVSDLAVTLLEAIPGVSGSGTLVRLEFTTIRSGQTQLNLFGVLLLDSSVSGITADTPSSTVEITGASIPEPSTLFLGAVGASLLIFWRRVRRPA